MIESVFIALSYVASIVGFMLIAVGCVALTAAWSRLSILESLPFASRMIGSFARTRRNLSLVACWYLSWGLYMALYPYEAPAALRFFLLAASLALMFPALRILRSGHDA